MSEQEENKNKDDRQDKGLFLKQVRESKNLSLMTVHEATKIPMDALRAIEENYTIRTLSQFYRRGFIKKYAQYLKVDISRVIDDYHSTELPKLAPNTKDDIWQDKFSVALSSGKTQMIARVIVIALAFFLVFKIGKFFISRRPRKSVEVSTIRRTSKKIPVVKKSKPREIIKKDTQRIQPKAVKPVAIAGEMSTAPASKEIPSRKQANQVQLTVRAKKSGWLRVKIDGDIVFQSTFKRRSVETWSGSEEIELSGRNINLLEFEHNGRAIDSLGHADRKVKRIVFTKSGFSIIE